VVIRGRAIGDALVMVLNLNQLRVFHAVATLKSVTRAADAVHLTQPGISRHIKELEEYYGDGCLRGCLDPSR
jgi:DNA-binding MarR family transcriptional regulator